MNYQEFINTYNGKSFDYDGVAGVQCVDLIKMYLDKVFEIKAGAWGNAKDYYENYNNLPLKSSFTRIANTPSFIPKKGDIVVWGVGLGNNNYKGFLGVLRPNAQNKITSTPVLKTLARNTNLRNKPTTENSSATLYVTNTTLYVLEAGVAQANGFTWDKVKIRVNGKEGYMINQNYK